MSDKLDFNSVLREKPEQLTAGIHVKTYPSVKNKLEKKAASKRKTLSNFLRDLFEKVTNDERE